MNNAALKKLLQQQPLLLWQGQNHYSQPNIISSGFPELDKFLPHNGWPLGTILEILTSQCGAGELRLLMPMMAALTQQGLYIAWIAPPYTPYAPSLLQHDIDVRYVIAIDAQTTERDQLWSMEKLLSCKECGMALMWPTSCTTKNIRRLQLAAEKGNSIGILYPRLHHPYSPAAMRISLQAIAINQLHLTILKARGVLKTTSTILSIPL